jgi:hypothetical protein
MKTVILGAALGAALAAGVNSQCVICPDGITVDENTKSPEFEGMSFSCYMIYRGSGMFLEMVGDSPTCKGYTCAMEIGCCPENAEFTTISECDKAASTPAPNPSLKSNDGAPSGGITFPGFRGFAFVTFVSAVYAAIGCV